MWSSEPLNVEDTWGLLQEPARPAKYPSNYLLLLAALDSGWRISEPIRWVSNHSRDGSRFYHFLLHHSRSSPSCWLVLPASPEVEQFIREERLSVQ
jgi:hypothetical protein